MGNTITQAERERLIALAKMCVEFDDAGNVVDYDTLVNDFAAEHGISDYRAKSYILHAALRLRGEQVRPGPGRPVSMEPGAPITIWLTPGHVGMASQLGNGNISAGVRLALEKWPWPAA